MLIRLRRLFEHWVWADERLLAALAATASPPAEAVREYAHVLGAGETWLSRLEERPARTAVWPALALGELPGLAASLHSGYAAHLRSLDEAGLDRLVAYTNSAGQSFHNAVGDILLQVALHAQYHRGKINLILRQAGSDPAPVDYIAFIRGVAAATTSRSTPPAG